MSFWKDFPGDFDHNAFGAILNRSVFKDPDLKDAELEFVDISRPTKNSKREVQIMSKKDLGDLTDSELKAYTDVFAGVYQAALQAHIEEEKRAGRSSSTPKGRLILDHPLLLR